MSQDEKIKRDESGFAVCTGLLQLREELGNRGYEPSEVMAAGVDDSDGVSPAQSTIVTRDDGELVCYVQSESTNAVRDILARLSIFIQE